MSETDRIRRLGITINMDGGVSLIVPFTLIVNLDCHNLEDSDVIFNNLGSIDFTVGDSNFSQIKDKLVTATYALSFVDLSNNPCMIISKYLNLLS